MRLPILVSACLLVASAAAQSVVFPSDHTNVVNGQHSMTWWPFSAAAPNRSQMIYDAWDLNLTTGTTITRIGFRQDGNRASPSQIVQMKVFMCETLTTSETLNNNLDFAGNYIGTPTEVWGPVPSNPNGLFTLPELFTSATAAEVWLDLTTPYVYQGGNLLVEFHIIYNNLGGAAFNYWLDRAGYLSEVITGVDGCPHAGGLTPTLDSDPARAGGNWRIRLSQAPLNMPVWLVATENTPMVQPYSLSIMGLDPNCQGQLSLASGIIIDGRTANAYGNFTWNVPVPNLLAFNDYMMTVQVVAFDLFSTGNLVVSNAEQVEFGINPASALLFRDGDPTVVTSGYVYNNGKGVVTLFN